MASSQFPPSHLLEPSALQAVLAGEHAHGAVATAHAGRHLALSYPTDIEESGRTHFAVASSTLGIDRPRVLAEAAVAHVSAITDGLSKASVQSRPPTRKEFSELESALNQVQADALAVQPIVVTYESDPGELPFEILKFEIDVPGLPEPEREVFVETHARDLLTIGATHPELLYQVARLCPPAAKNAQASAKRKLKKADSDAHKRFERAASTTHVPFRADVIELARNEVQLRREAAADLLSADVYLRAGTAARDGKTAAQYLLKHRDELSAALDELREGIPHLGLDNAIPADIVLNQLPAPAETSRELAAVLYDAVAREGSTPATVARSLFDAITRDLEQVRLDPVLATLEYLGQAGYSDDALVARATDELIAPLLASHADKAATVLSGVLPQPTCFLIHTSPFSLPVAPGLFEQELRVSDPALDDVIVILSLYPYRINQLAFYPEARQTLDSPDSHRYYPNPARKPRPAVTRTSLNGSLPTPPTYAEELVLPAN